MATIQTNIPGAGIGNAPSSEASKLSGQAERAAEQLASSALDRVNQAKERAQSGLSEQRTVVTQRIRRVGEALKATGDDLRAEDAMLADYLGQASAKVESVASYVGALSPSHLASDIQRFARERPAWFFGGTFLVGLAVGRFLKSSSAASRSRQEDLDTFTTTQSRTLPSARSNYPTSDRPMSSAGYSEPRVYGGGSSNYGGGASSSTHGGGPSNGDSDKVQATPAPFGTSTRTS